MKRLLVILVILSVIFYSCEKNEIKNDSLLKLKLELNSSQERLNNIGTPSVMPVNHAGQTPDFRSMSVHFIELLPTQFTPYKSGAILYSGAEIDADNPNPYGFVKAINFEEALIIEDGEVFLQIPIKDIPPGNYKHIRASVSYQNYDVKFNLKEIPGIGDLDDQNGTIASFLGYNTFLKDLKIRDETLPVNEFKLQGFWAFETDLSSPWADYNQISSGQAPSNATTVVNPFPQSPIPPGSCVVSGSLNRDFSVAGAEDKDVNISLSFSINKSFEWEDLNGNGEWDLNTVNASRSEKVVDMGVRGLIGKIE